MKSALKILAIITKKRGRDENRINTCGMEVLESSGGIVFNASIL